MANKEKEKLVQEIAEKLCNNLGVKGRCSKSGSLLLIDEESFVSLFICSYLEQLFHISEEDREKFNEAFRIVANGKGQEIGKINSVISSSLLSLLFFYKLFNSSDSELSITIEGVEYNKAFFEVRNKCVKSPSCVDVALWSENAKTLLFLESKFIEFIRDAKIEETKYSQTYFTLYENKDLEGILENGREDYGIKVEDCKLKSKNGKEIYIEGIKQSICHLIGLVRGPQIVTDKNDPYYKESKEYEKAFDEANKTGKIIYGTILFDSKKMEVNDEGRYKDLYEDIIGANGKKIVETISDWKRLKGKKYKDKIEFLKSPLTYQDIIEQNTKYLSKLPEPIVNYYGFKKEKPSFDGNDLQNK